MAKEDIDAVVALASKIMPEAWTKAAFIAALSLPEKAWLFIEDNKIIGFLVIQLSPDVAEILTMGIAKEYQSKGYASLLLQHALQYIDSQSINTVWLELRESNVDAYHLYKKFGFNVVGNRKDYYSRGEGKECALLMELIIR